MKNRLKHDPLNRTSRGPAQSSAARGLFAALPGSCFPPQKIFQNFFKNLKPDRGLVNLTGVSGGALTPDGGAVDTSETGEQLPELECAQTG